RGGVGQRPFRPKVALENFHDFPGQRQGARFPTLAENVQLRIGQFQIFDLERQDSQERRPSSNIRPTTAKSRKLRKLVQNWATCCAVRGWMTRRGCLRRRPKATVRWGRP